MVATWVFGLWLAWLIGSLWTDGWFQAKLVFVVALTGLSGCWRAGCGRSPRTGTPRPARFFRIVNEVADALHDRDRDPGRS